MLSFMEIEQVLGRRETYLDIVEFLQKMSPDLIEARLEINQHSQDERNLQHTLSLILGLANEDKFCQNLNNFEILMYKLAALIRGVTLPLAEARKHKIEHARLTLINMKSTNRYHNFNLQWGEFMLRNAMRLGEKSGKKARSSKSP